MNTDESIFTLMMQRYPYMLTKLNIKDPEEFSILEADRPSYNDEIAMERQIFFYPLEADDNLIIKQLWHECVSFSK